MIVFGHSAKPETVPENAPEVSVMVEPFLSVPTKKFTVLVGLDVPVTITVLALTVVCATGSVIVTAVATVVSVLPAVIVIGFAISANVSLSVTVIS